MRWLTDPSSRRRRDARASAGDERGAPAASVLWRSQYGVNPLFQVIVLIFRGLWWTDAAERIAFDGRAEELDAETASANENATVTSGNGRR